MRRSSSCHTDLIRAPKVGEIQGTLPLYIASEASIVTMDDLLHMTDCPLLPAPLWTVSVRVMDIDQFMNSKRLFKDIRKRSKAQRPPLPVMVHINYQ